MVNKLKLNLRYVVALAVLASASPAFAQAYSPGYGFPGVVLVGWLISTIKWFMAVSLSESLPGHNLGLQRCQHRSS